MSLPIAPLPEDGPAAAELQVPTDFQGLFDPHATHGFLGPWDLLQSLAIAVLVVGGLMVLVSLLTLSVAPV